MKSEPISPIHRVASSATRSLVTVVSSFSLIGSLLLLSTLQADAQDVTFRANPVRVTVPLNSTDVTMITNHVFISTNPAPATPVTFSVSGLPAGAGYTLTDTNDFPVSSSLVDIVL